MRQVTWVTRDDADRAVAARIAEVDSVLDIGPGIRPQGFVKASVHVCVEPYLPYIERLREASGDDPRFVFLNGAWEAAAGLLPDKSIDSVFALDVIEHFEKEEGRRFLLEVERIARRQVVIFTPLGFSPQTYDGSSPLDRWGMDGGTWQTHRSGWEPEDFHEGWDIICCREYHLVDQNEEPLEVPGGALWAFLNRPPGPRVRSRFGSLLRRLLR